MCMANHGIKYLELIHITFGDKKFIPVRVKAVVWNKTFQQYGLKSYKTSKIIILPFKKY